MPCHVGHKTMTAFTSKLIKHSCCCLFVFGQADVFLRCSNDADSMRGSEGSKHHSEPQRL